MQNALIFLIKTFADLYVLTFLLRLLLQWVRADFYNPFSQFVIRVTDPLVRPLRRRIRPAGGLDLATLIVVVGLECIATWVIMSLYGIAPTVLDLLRISALRLVSLGLWFYSVSLFIYVILSWVSPGGYNPAAVLLADLVEPVLRPVRRFIPSIGGLDLSPMLVLIALQAVAMALPLPNFLR
jgi:YggT family protein